jgi:hypothetical protein
MTNAEDEIIDLETLPTGDYPDLNSANVREVGEGVYYARRIRFARIVFHEYFIDLKDNLNGTNWAATEVTVSITLGGGNAGRDHWGWPGEPFAQVRHFEVTSNGIFRYWIEDVSDSSVVAGVFRWIRGGRHGATGRTWQR